ncbi:MAG: hypothetical protein IPL01_05895 [Acidobacteria bacterium]|nr:hypothetical protein [Acidobacteriota bacterium]
MVEQVIAEFRLDVLVNNAGMFEASSDCERSASMTGGARGEGRSMPICCSGEYYLLGGSEDDQSGGGQDGQCLVGPGHFKVNRTHPHTAPASGLNQ